MRLHVLAGAVAALSALAPAQVGRIDTVGGTTYDWQNGGPAYRWIVNAPSHGIPVCWMRSRSDQTHFPDRNMGYNYYDYATRRWLANDTADFMNSGRDIFTVRSGYGTLDIDPRTGQAVLSAHLGAPIHPDLAREIGHGSFLFEYASGSPVLDGYLWPVTVVDTAGWVHCALIDDASHDRLYHARMRTWGVWDPPLGIPAPRPDPMFPCHQLAASRVSHRVVVTWVHCDGERGPGFYRETTDGGTTWLDPLELSYPPAYSGDTLPAYGISGLFPFYDRDDRLHIVCPVMPWVGGRGYVTPIEIWHWCRENSPQWSKVVRVGDGYLPAAIGYNALVGDRPSLGEDRGGGLHVCWEAFDTTNIEPGPPEYLRADIWWCEDNDDNGASWAEPVRITVPDSTSKRFPCIIDRMSEDTLRVLYLVDLVAGFAVQGEGDPTENPVVVQHVPVTVAGASVPGPLTSVRPGWLPSVARGELVLNAAFGGPGSRPALLDVSGRRVMALAPGVNDVSRLSPGVYFIRSSLGDGNPVTATKVVIQR
jgi:hypothetical protein